MEKTREFKIVKISYAGSSKKSEIAKGKVVKGTTPSSAAVKAFNDSCKANKKKSKCTSTMTIEDLATTKLYTYKLTRKHDPKTVELGGSPVVFKYTTTVKAVKK